MLLVKTVPPANTVKHQCSKFDRKTGCVKSAFIPCNHWHFQVRFVWKNSKNLTTGQLTRGMRPAMSRTMPVHYQLASLILTKRTADFMAKRKVYRVFPNTRPGRLLFSNTQGVLFRATAFFVCFSLWKIRYWGKRWAVILKIMGMLYCTEWSLHVWRCTNCTTSEKFMQEIHRAEVSDQNREETRGLSGSVVLHICSRLNMDNIVVISAVVRITSHEKSHKSIIWRNENGSYKYPSPW